MEPQFSSSMLCTDCLQRLDNQLDAIREQLARAEISRLQAVTRSREVVEALAKECPECAQELKQTASLRLFLAEMGEQQAQHVAAPPALRGAVRASLANQPAKRGFWQVLESRAPTLLPRLAWGGGLALTGFVLLLVAQPIIQHQSEQPMPAMESTGTGAMSQDTNGSAMAKKPSGVARMQTKSTPSKNRGATSSSTQDTVQRDEKGRAVTNPPEVLPNATPNRSQSKAEFPKAPTFDSHPVPEAVFIAPPASGAKRRLNNADTQAAQINTAGQHNEAKPAALDRVNTHAARINPPGNANTAQDDAGNTRSRLSQTPVLDAGGRAKPKSFGNRSGTSETPRFDTQNNVAPLPMAPPQSSSNRNAAMSSSVAGNSPSTFSVQGKSRVELQVMVVSAADDENASQFGGGFGGGGFNGGGFGGARAESNLRSRNGDLPQTNNSLQNGAIADSAPNNVANNAAAGTVQRAMKGTERDRITDLEATPDTPKMARANSSKAKPPIPGASSNEARGAGANTTNGQTNTDVDTFGGYGGFSPRAARDALAGTAKANGTKNVVPQIITPAAPLAMPAMPVVERRVRLRFQISQAVEKAQISITWPVDSASNNATGAKLQNRIIWSGTIRESEPIEVETMLPQIPGGTFTAVLEQKSGDGQSMALATQNFLVP